MISKKSKFLIFQLILLLAFDTHSEAQDYYSMDCYDYYYNYGDCGYPLMRDACCFAPAIALGTVAAVAILVVLIQNNTSGGSIHKH